MQNRHDNYNPPPADFTLAVESYLKTLQKLRLPNTLTNQLVSAREFIENAKQVQIKKDWLNSYLNMLIQSRLEASALLEEVRLHYEEMLKFAQNNPIMMTTGTELKEWDLAIELERKKTMQELEKIIKELEKLILILSERRQALTKEIAQFRKEIDDLEEKSYEAALNLYTTPKDPDEHTKINLADITSLHPYLPKDKTKHFLHINHKAIINKLKQKLRKNPKNINESRLDDDMHQAVQEDIQKNLDAHLKIHFSHAPEAKREEAASQIKVHAPEVHAAIRIHINPDHELLIKSNEKEIKKIEEHASDIADKIEYIDDAIQEYKKELKTIHSQHDVVFHMQAQTLISGVNDKKTTAEHKPKKTNVFIERHSAISNSPIFSNDAPEQSQQIPSSQKRKSNFYERKRSALPPLTKSAKNEPTIKIDEDKNKAQHSQLQEHGLFSSTPHTKAQEENTPTTKPKTESTTQNTTHQKKATRNQTF